MSLSGRVCEWNAAKQEASGTGVSSGDGGGDGAIAVAHVGSGLVAGVAVAHAFERSSWPGRKWMLAVTVQWSDPNPMGWCGAGRTDEADIDGFVAFGE